MPLNGNTYVAPTWRNGQPPALDAAELQAISDSIVRNQGKNADQDSLIAALQTAVGSLQAGSAKIEVGSYVGTGTYGADNPNSITCSFAPKVVIVMSKNVGGNSSFFMVWIYNSTSNYYSIHTGSSSPITAGFILNNNTLSWIANTNPTYQGNLSGIEYCFVVIGQPLQLVMK